MGLSCEDLVEQIWDALEEEDYDEAEACGRRALMMDRSSVDARIGLARALLGKDQAEAALAILREAAALAPQDPDVATELGVALFEHCEFDEAEERLALALRLGAESPDAHYWTALVLERRGRYGEAERYFAAAETLDPQGYPLPVRFTQEEFRDCVERARMRLPGDFDAALENVAIRVEDVPEEAVLKDSDPPLDPCLLGLFVGVPLTEKLATDTAPRMPDSVYLFKRNLERSCEDGEMLVDEIYTTLYHEIGHYLGLDEDDLARRGFA